VRTGEGGLKHAAPAAEQLAEELVSGLFIVYDQQFTVFHSAVIYP
jgi:hypothetical protein